MKRPEVPLEKGEEVSTHPPEGERCHSIDARESTADGELASRRRGLEGEEEDEWTRSARHGEVERPATSVPTIRPRLGEFNAQDVANLSWAYATAEMQGNAECLETLSQLPHVAAGFLETFTSQGLSNTVWAFATMGLASPELMTTIALEGSSRRATTRVL